MKSKIKQILRNWGIELRLHKYSPQISEAARMKQLLDYHEIDLVMDVGANIGQYAKYNRERHQKLGDRARQKAEQEFTMEIQAERYLSLFREIV